MWRDWFTFSRQDRRAIFLLTVLIVLVMALLCTKPLWHGTHTVSFSSTDSVMVARLQPEASQPIVQIALHPFNPNTADSLELLSVGLPPYVARNILRYRKAGGSFRRPDDLARIYGLHDTTFARVRPYIEIPSERPMERKYDAPRVHTEPDEQPAVITEPLDTPRHEHPYAEYMRAKHKPGEFVDLNRADTAELMKIPGIGPVYARMIVEYRQRLGGFHSVAQLRELDASLPNDLGDWVHVGTPATDKLRVNRLSVTQLRSHPYLTFYQARAIVDLRKREGNIRSARQLLFLDEFTEADIERLQPYLSFE